MKESIRTLKKKTLLPKTDTFRSDPLFPRIELAVATLLTEGKVVAPVEVLIRMGLLTPAKVEDWRRGRLPYLERAITCNFTRVSRLLRILRFHAHDLNLVPSVIVYTRWGKGPSPRLRFTKTGDSKLEESYAKHFVWPGKVPFHPPVHWTGDTTSPDCQIGCGAPELGEVGLPPMRSEIEFPDSSTTSFSIYPDPRACRA